MKGLNTLEDTRNLTIVERLEKLSTVDGFFYVWP